LQSITFVEYYVCRVLRLQSITFVDYYVCKVLSLQSITFVEYYVCRVLRLRSITFADHKMLLSDSRRFIHDGVTITYAHMYMYMCIHSVSRGTLVFDRPHSGVLRANFNLNFFRLPSAFVYKMNAGFIDSVNHQTHILFSINVTKYLI